MPQVCIEARSRRGHNFAESETRTQHRCDVIVHDVHFGEKHTVRRIGALRNDELHGRALRDGAGPFHIQIGFAFFVIAHNSGIGAVHNDLWRLGRQAVFRSERIHIVDVEVAAADDGNRLPCAVVSFIPESRDIIDGCEIVWDDAVTAGREVVIRPLVHAMKLWFGNEVME